MFSEIELEILKTIKEEFQGKIRNRNEFEKLISILKHEKGIDFNLFISSLLSIEEKVKNFLEWLPLIESCGLFDSEANLILPEEFENYLSLVREYGIRRNYSTT
jgi:hypothetical protein